MINDQKFSRTFLPPIGLILSLLAIALLPGLTKSIWINPGFLGFYTLLKGLERENIVRDFINAVKQPISTSRISYCLLHLCECTNPSGNIPRHSRK